MVWIRRVLGAVSAVCVVAAIVAVVATKGRPIRDELAINTMLEPPTVAGPPPEHAGIIPVAPQGALTD